MISRLLLYMMGGLAGIMCGAGLALYLVREEGLSEPLAGVLTGCVIAVFLGLAHTLSRTMVEEEREPPGDLVSPVVRPPPCAAFLIPTAGGQGRVAYPLQKACTLIGRDVENDFMINSGSISRSHAQIVRMDDSYLVLDLDSKNGTFVNGERVVQKQLHDGDELVLGSVHFRLRIEDFDAPREDVPADLTLSAGPAAPWEDIPGTLHSKPEGSTYADRTSSPGSPWGPRGAASGENSSWTAAAREESWGTRDPDRRRAPSPFDPPYPPDRDRRRGPYPEESSPQ